MSTFDSRYAGSTDRVSGRHPISIGHLVMGIAFLGIVVVWALVEADAVSGDDIRWLLPVPWVLAGIAGLIATTRRSRHEERAYASQARGWVGDEPVTRGYDRLDELDDLPDPVTSDEIPAEIPAETTAETTTETTTETTDDTQENR
jgi:hypothetical protein